MTTLLVIGIRESANFNNLIVFIKVVVILLLSALAPATLFLPIGSPSFPTTRVNSDISDGAEFSRSRRHILCLHRLRCGIHRRAGSQNPQKDMPWGILGSLLVCTILYILVGLIMTGIVPFANLNDPAPVAVAVNTAGEGMAWLRLPIKIGAIAGLSSVILVMLMGQPRIFFAMSRDGLLPPAFGKVHSKYFTPYITTIVTGAVAAIIAGLFPIGILGELVSIGTLLAFALVCGGILVLRYKSPDIHRPFKTPFSPLYRYWVYCLRWVLWPPYQAIHGCA